MSQINLPKPVWVCGITKDPDYEGERPKGSYVFFELDAANEEYRDEVLKVYAEMRIPVLYHRIRRGYHFFGDIRPDSVRVELLNRLAHLNLDGCFNTTLRITRKTEDEVFELPSYQGPEPRPNWAKALRWFLQQVHDKNVTDPDKTAKQCGLHKYWKPQKGHHLIFYPLCPVCLSALPSKPENKLKHYQEAHQMFREGSA